MWLAKLIWGKMFSRFYFIKLKQNWIKLNESFNRSFVTEPVVRVECWKSRRQTQKEITKFAENADFYFQPARTGVFQRVNCDSYLIHKVSDKS